MIDIRFATALQMMLTLALAEKCGQPLVTSAQLANGLGSTSSLVRRLLVPLGRSELVRSSLGKAGGVRLARPAGAIHLSEIYQSVMGDKPLLAGRPDVPHLCDVSSHVEVYFSELASDVQDAVVAMLGGRTLEQSLEQVLALKVRPRSAKAAPAQTPAPGRRRLVRHHDAAKRGKN